MLLIKINSIITEGRGSCDAKVPRALVQLTKLLRDLVAHSGVDEDTVALLHISTPSLHRVNSCCDRHASFPARTDSVPRHQTWGTK